jgi:hypothetical protein
LGLGRGHAQVDHVVFARETVNGILEMFEPGDEFVAPIGRNARGLVSEIGRDVTVGEDHLALIEGRGKLLPGFEAIARIQKCREARIDLIERAKFAIEELADHLAEPRIVVGKASGVNLSAACGQGFLEQVELGALAAPVDAFQSNEFARGCGHVGRQFNQRRAGPQRGVTGCVVS